MTIRTFERASRQEMATIVAKQFDIGRNLVLAATVESMTEAIKHNNAGRLRRMDGTQLLKPAKPAELAAAHALILRLATALERFDDQRYLVLIRKARRLAK